MTMNFTDRFFNLKIAVVDLESRETRILPLPAAAAAETLGGAALNRHVYEQYRRDDPLILGTGPLTGSFAPGACLMVATFKSASGALCHTPLVAGAGPGLKFSGLDLLVIRGSAPSPVKFVAAVDKTECLALAEPQSSSVPETWHNIRREHAPRRCCAVLTGPAADSGFAHAAVSVGVQGASDRQGLAARMAAMNLKAVVLEGGGGLQFGEDNLPLRGKMLGALEAAGKVRAAGCLSVLDGAGLPQAVRPYIAKAVKRNFACYNCPFPCVGVVPQVNRSVIRGREALFIADHAGLAALARAGGRHCLAMFRECQALGLDPAAAARAFDPEKGFDAWVSTVREAAGAGTGQKAWCPEAADASSADGQNEDVRNFGAGLPTFMGGAGQGAAQDRHGRAAAAMVLGICPLIPLRFPEISDAALLEFISGEPVARDALAQRLSASAAAL